ncbi:MAG: response regulator transcription factor [Verrucomicrobiae bacterium]|nr:response regulator transcription factor [Verrucomicrobiae bacterium]
MRPTNSITVVIADDHPIFRRGLCDILASDPALRLVGEAGDGEEAWRLIQELRPAVAVLDIHMPRRSGIELGGLVSQRRLPVELIILTMDAEEGLLHEALNLGVKGYLLKENAIAELLQAIHRVAGGDCYICPALSTALVQRNAAWKALHEQKVGLAKLSPTERQILKLISEDRTSKEIAEILHSRVRTVETHRQNISHKLNLSGSHSLLRFAFDHKAQL